MTSLHPALLTCSRLSPCPLLQVYIPLPSALHLHWVQAAAAAGKHILLEKPVAINEQELDGIMEACRAAGVQLMDGTM